MQTTISDKITIVIPCKNEENYIHHLLDALREQDIGDTRVIIADCSTDNDSSSREQSSGRSGTNRTNVQGPDQLRNDSGVNEMAIKV